LTKNILIVTQEFPPLPGGIGNHAFHLANQLYSNGYSVTVITEKRCNSDEQWNDFVHSNSNISIIGVKRYKPLIITYLLRIFIYLYLSFKLKATVIFSGKFPIWMAAIPIKNKKISVIHGSEIKQFGIWKRLFQKGLNNSSSVISVSKFTQNKMLELYEVSIQRLCVINNGFGEMISVEAFNKSIFNKNELKFITVGGMHKRKGQHNFIRTLPEILKKFPDSTYIVCGLPVEKIELMEQAKKLGIEKAVHFYDAPSNDEVKRLILSSDVFVMLSENLENGDFEGFGIAIIEAMSLGLPSIGSLNTGIEDAISPGISGELVDAANNEQIINAIDKIVGNYSDYSENAVTWANKFQWKDIVNAYIERIEN
jgi:phosphatidylinositol alpha-1,6-mannosyltransferase